MRRLIGNNLKKVMTKNDGEIHINDVIHWAHDHEYDIRKYGILTDANDKEFDSYLVQDVSKEQEEKESIKASDRVILILDSNGVIHSYTRLI